MRSFFLSSGDFPSLMYEVTCKEASERVTLGFMEEDPAVSSQRGLFVQSSGLPVMVAQTMRDAGRNWK